ncbi:MAG: type II secretion system protein, partial [Planctomycetota bacterium]
MIGREKQHLISQYGRQAPAKGRYGQRPARRVGPCLCSKISQRQKRPGFTLMELMVSIAVLLLLLTMIGTIFAMATRASSQAHANNEVMLNLRTLQDQIGQDLDGLQQEAFIGSWYQLTTVTDPDQPVDPNNLTQPNTMLVRTDRIVFFNAQKNHSINQCYNPLTGAIVNCDDSNATSISGRARIFYGHYLSCDPDPTATPTIFEQDPRNWILARRAKILSPGIDLSTITVPSRPSEYDAIEVESESQNAGIGPPYTIEDWQNHSLFTINSFFDLSGLMDEDRFLIPSWIRRPFIRIDLANPGNNRGLHMYFIPGCVEFKIQRWIEHNPFTGTPLQEPRWYPEEDFNGDGIIDLTIDDSDFFQHNTLNSVSVNAPPFQRSDTDILEYFNGPIPT